jgi:hypothetical protein
MATYTYPIDEERNIYPNITVRQRLRDGVLTGWQVTANEGYVIYDPTEFFLEFDPETMEDISVNHYFTEVLFPAMFNWDNFHYVAVLRSTVDENYIFGGSNDNNHEVM